MALAISFLFGAAVSVWLERVRRASPDYSRLIAALDQDERRDG